MKNAAYEIIERKGGTWFAIGLGLTTIFESIIRDENAVLIVSSYIHDYYGVSDLCISAPTIIDKNGIKKVLKLPLEEEEIQQFQQSASTLKKTLQSIKFKKHTI